MEYNLSITSLVKSYVNILGSYPKAGTALREHKKKKIIIMSEIAHACRVVETVECCVQRSVLVCQPFLQLLCHFELPH